MTNDTTLTIHPASELLTDDPEDYAVNVGDVYRIQVTMNDGSTVCSDPFIATRSHINLRDAIDGAEWYRVDSVALIESGE